MLAMALLLPLAWWLRGVSGRVQRILGEGVHLREYFHPHARSFSDRSACSPLPIAALLACPRHASIRCRGVLAWP